MRPVRLKYTKMQGLGNDFIIMDNRTYKYKSEELQSLARKVCQRRISVGADGFMAIEEAQSKADFKMLFFNADGTIGEMCGNGARCIARYAYKNHIAKQEMIFETTAGNVYAMVDDNERTVSVALNLPEIINLDMKIDIEGQEFMVSYIELGNPGVPHGVIEYKNLEQMSRDDLLELGRQLRYHKAFYKGANINFYNINSASSAIVRTYERGVEDFTLACGTGAASVAVVLWLKQLVKGNRINLKVPGGDLTIEITTDKNNLIERLLLIGNTNIVAEGWITDEDIDLDLI
ncbi:MAG: diaminopimelate epimerase [Tissierellales bacterium]|nr:diaminopimelate epimerase [Tissierellales bacterium]MBN2827082.1 diaminopimelate epimerase [Tissierellales bacterium]